MRPAEWIHVAVFSFFCLLAWIQGLPGERRAKVIGIGAVGLAANLTGAFLLPASVRDWLPAALILLVYWQIGQCFVRVDQRLQDRLEAIDAKFLPLPMRWLARRPCIAACLEFAYLFCYPMIPMSFGTLYWLGLAHSADRLWTVVLGSAYLYLWRSPVRADVSATSARGAVADAPPAESHAGAEPVDSAAR